MLTDLGGTSTTFPDQAMPFHLALSPYLLAANLVKSVVDVSLMVLLCYCSSPITLSDASLVELAVLFLFNGNVRCLLSSVGRACAS